MKAQQYLEQAQLPKDITSYLETLFEKNAADQSSSQELPYFTFDERYTNIIKCMSNAHSCDLEEILRYPQAVIEFFLSDHKFWLKLWIIATFYSRDKSREKIDVIEEDYDEVCETTIFIIESIVDTDPRSIYPRLVKCLGREFEADIKIETDLQKTGYEQALSR